MMLQLQGTDGYKYNAVEALLSLLSIKQVISNPFHSTNNPQPTHPHQPTCLLTSPLVCLFLQSFLCVTSSDPIPEHDGLREDGQPDKRVGTGRKKSSHIPNSRFTQSNISTEFAQGKVDPVEAGKQGGATGGESGGASSGGSDDSGSSGKGQFAGGKVDPAEAGRKGGKSSN
jgi:uncharacterized membrane protein YgcG